MENKTRNQATNHLNKIKEFEFMVMLICYMCGVTCWMNFTRQFNHFRTPKLVCMYNGHCNKKFMITSDIVKVQDFN